MNQPSPGQIATLRASSRQLVRELGFLNQTLAGSGLAASSVHALIEIAQGHDITARLLSELLLLEKSTISRMLLSLIRKGLVEERPSARDSRVKYLHLSQQGHVRHRVIANSAEQQIIAALTPLPPDGQQCIVSGIESYTSALTACRLQSGGTEKAGIKEPQAVQLHTGYVPGLIGRITRMHALFYGRSVGFGASFEAVVAGGLAEFATRMENPDNLILRAEQEERIVGSITIDGEDLGPKLAHLRWFIVDDGLRGAGIGNRLISKAVEFCDRKSFTETHLWTFQGLDAARRLYERHGFRLAEESHGDQWGDEVLEQKFVRPLGG